MRERESAHLGPHRPALLEVSGVRPQPPHLLQNLRETPQIDEGGQGHEAGHEALSGITRLSVVTRLSLACGAQDSPS